MPPVASSWSPRTDAVAWGRAAGAALAAERDPLGEAVAGLAERFALAEGVVRGPDRAALHHHVESGAERSLPVVSTQCGFASMFLAFCSSGPVQKYRDPSSHIAGSGVTCGRPSRRTV